MPSDLIRHGDTVFAVTSEDRLVALDLKTGRLKWERFSGADRSDRSYPTSPRIAGSVVLFGGRNGLVQALDPGTGDVKWTRQLNGRVSTPPTLIDGGVYVGSSKGSIYRLHPATGEIEHELVLPGSASRESDAHRERHRRSRLRKQHRESRSRLTRIRWQQSGRGWAFRPLIWKGLIVLGNAGGDLFTLRPRGRITRMVASFQGDRRVDGSLG